MSRENVEMFTRRLEAYNRRDIGALLATVDPAVEWHPLLMVLLGGEATVYRGHAGVRELVRELDGKGFRVREYLTPDEALEAVGLRE